MGKKVLVGVFTIVVIALLVIGGIVIYNDVISNREEEFANNIINIENEVDSDINTNIEIVETVSDENKVSPNCIFIFKTYYPLCDHLKVEKEQVSETMVNKTRDDLNKIYKEWEIVTFRNDEVLFYKEEEGICNEHYLLKEVDGYIAIYSLDEDEDATLKETTSIVTTYLPEDDIQKLKEGIRVNGKEELNRTLEDYE